MSGTYFGTPIDTSSLAGCFFALVLSIMLGGAVGFERERGGHPAGFRTHVMVCLGSALVTLVSRTWGSDRIAAQIVTGIGFLGAGAIIREGATVRGLTTAASVWVVAGIGIGIGSSPRGAEYATVGTIVILFTLMVLQVVEEKMRSWLKGPVLIDILISERLDAPELVLQALAQLEVRVLSFSLYAGAAHNTRHIAIRVQSPPTMEHDVILSRLSKVEGVLEIHRQ